MSGIYAEGVTALPIADALELCPLETFVSHYFIGAQDAASEEMAGDEEAVEFDSMHARQMTHFSRGRCTFNGQW